MRHRVWSFITVLTVGLVLMVPANLFAGDSGNSLKVGGAIRYNIIHTNYESDPTPLSTAFTWDTWRLNVDGSAAGIDLSFEYRFYPTFGTHFIQHGYLGYAFSDKLYGKLGVFQKPFGITKYASHSWWFQGGYYVGLEDDYDMGIGFFYEATPSMHINLAYYRQAEPEGPSYNGVVTFGNAGPGRYSYDVVPSPGNNASLREMNTVNAQVTYDLSKALQVGISGQFGQLYNSVLDDASMASAYAAHLVANFGPLNLKTEFINYDYTAQGDDGTDLDIVYMGAYGFPYPVAARANLYVAGLAYSIPVKMGPISNIQAYVDYTLTDKANSNYEDTALLIPGFLVSAGKVYTYVDYAMGVNQPWLTDTFGIGLGQGVANAKWNKRFNVNIGYYF